MTFEEIYALAVAFLFGTLFGSFLNAVVYRLPLGESILRPSQCPRCDRPIRWYHNVPILGWVRLRGRCPDCGERISVRYPLVELAGGILMAAAVARWGLTVSAASTVIFSYLMLTLALIDVDHRILPNVITLPGAVAGFVLSFLDPRVTPLDSFLGGFLGGGILYGVAWLYLRARGREGMGMGDVKMMLLVGAFLGWRGAFMTIFIGSLLGSLVGLVLIRLSRKEWEYALPFGTFLAGAAIVVDYWGEELLAWYLRVVVPGS